MNTKQIRQLIHEKTNLDVAIDLDNSHIRLNEDDVNNILSMFDIWSDYIDNIANKVILLKNLLTDLNVLGCCAISGHPKSPCYIGKVALCDPNGAIDVSKYTRYRLRGCLRNDIISWNLSNSY